jgi:hypothetical protein
VGRPNIQVLVRQGSAHGLDVASAAPRPDGTGIDVGVVPGKLGLAAAARGVAAVTSALGVAAHVSQRARPVEASRWADTAPWWGGDVIVDFERTTNNAAICSGGFGVEAGGLEFLLTANHCRINGGGDTFYTPQIARIGPAYEWDLDHDTTIIGSTTAQNEIYTGGTDPSGAGAGEDFTQVAGTKTPRVGDLVCASGGLSGEICDSLIVATGLTIQYSSGITVYNQVEAEQQVRDAAVGNGDSGGPAYAFDLNGNALAEGIITAIDPNTAVACNGVPTGGGRICAWRWDFSNIDDAINFYKLSVLTH